MSKPAFLAIAHEFMGKDVGQLLPETAEALAKRLESIYDVGAQQERERVIIHIANMAEIHRNAAAGPGMINNGMQRLVFLKAAEQLGRAKNEIAKGQHWTLKKR